MAQLTQWPQRVAAESSGFRRRFPPFYRRRHLNACRLCSLLSAAKQVSECTELQTITVPYNTYCIVTLDTDRTKRSSRCAIGDSTRAAVDQPGRR